MTIKETIKEIKSWKEMFQPKLDKERQLLKSWLKTKFTRFVITVVCECQASEAVNSPRKWRSSLQSREFARWELGGEVSMAKFGWYWWEVFRKTQGFSSTLFHPDHTISVDHFNYFHTTSPPTVIGQFSVALTDKNIFHLLNWSSSFLLV